MKGYVVSTTVAAGSMLGVQLAGVDERQLLWAIGAAVLAALIEYVRRKMGGG